MGDAGHSPNQLDVVLFGECNEDSFEVTVELLQQPLLSFGDIPPEFRFRSGVKPTHGRRTPA